jgi:hypothetical protein
MASKEVDDAVGEAPARKAKGAVEVLVQVLAEKREALAAAHRAYATAKARRDERAMSEETRLVASLVVIIDDLEREAAEAREQEARQRANERVLGISRAVGSVIASLQGDDERVLEAARAYAAAVERLNDRYRQYEGLAAEDAALRDRFGIAGAKIPRVTSPDETASVVAAVRTIDAVNYASFTISRPLTEQDDTGYRERRTYEEIGGTPAYAIIEAVGLKPWRPLTEREQLAIAALGAEKDANSRFLGDLDVEGTIAQALGAAGVPDGAVHRG